jgi:hypothetical protein
VVQLNYQSIAQEAALHRSIVQRMLLEMLQRIAMHIVAGHGIRVEFPTVGTLQRNRAGRIEFVFDAAVVEPLALGLRPVRSAAGPCSGQSSARCVQQAMVGGHRQALRPRVDACAPPTPPLTPQPLPAHAPRAHRRRLRLAQLVLHPCQHTCPPGARIAGVQRSLSGT